MTAFNDLTDEMDDILAEQLGDAAMVNGRPVRGFFSSPWLQPRFGRASTGLREPHMILSRLDAAGVEKGAEVFVDLPAPDGGEFVVVSVEPDGSGQIVLVLRRK